MPRAVAGPGLVLAALDLALFTTIALSAANDQLSGAAALQSGVTVNDTLTVVRAGQALTHGCTTTFLAGGGLLLVAAVIVIAAITTRRTQHYNQSRQGA